MGSSSGGSSSGGGGGGNDKPAKKKKATPKAKVYASPNEQGQKTAPKVKAKVKAPKINYGGNGNQRANLPSEVAKQYAQPASTRPATSIVSTAQVFSGPAKATITSSPMQSISAAENAQIDTAFAAKRTPKIKTTMGTETTGYGVNNSILGATGTSMMASLNSTNPLKASPTSTQVKAVTNGSVPSYSQGNGAMSAASSPLKQAKPLLSVAPTNLPARNYGAFDMDTYQSVAKTNEDSIIPSVLLSAIKNDKYRCTFVSH